MRKKYLKFVWAVLFSLPVCSWATDITFTSSGTIEDGDVYGSVYVQNDGTIIDMSGGQIQTNLITFDSSIFNMSGGQIVSSGGYACIGVNNLSTINISGGTIDGATFGIYGSVNISGGNITGNVNKANPNSILNITGGNLSFGDFYIYGTLKILGGLVSINNPYFSSTSVYIYGSGFNYNSSTQILTGYLLDNNPFTIKGVDQLEYTRLNLIPEPVSLLLFGFGLLSLRRVKQ